jgi:hypothetical protein
MWATLLAGVLKRPWIIALVAMAAFMGVQWVKINSLKGDILDLRDDIQLIQTNFNTCKHNEVSLKDAIDKCNGESADFEANITLLNEMVITEKERVAYWQEKYNKKVCYDPCTDVPEEGKEVLNDENNVDAINRINDIFKP